MRVIVEIAMDRKPDEMLEAFVRPLDATLREEDWDGSTRIRYESSSPSTSA